MIVVGILHACSSGVDDTNGVVSSRHHLCLIGYTSISSFIVQLI